MSEQTLATYGEVELFSTIASSLARNETIALVTVVRAEGSAPRQVGSKMAVRLSGEIVGTIGGGTVEFQAIERAREALRLKRPEVFRVHLTRDLGMCCGGAMEIFIDPLLPSPWLVLLGAGHVAQEVAVLASRAGFAVVVIDEREEFCTEARFPTAKRLLLEDPLFALKTLDVGDDAYFVIVTHSHRLDEDLLRTLASRRCRYLGMIGSRGKVARFMGRLEARGIPAEQLEHVYMPIGLSIGANSPAEIAISIVAELIRIRNQAGSGLEAAGPLRWRPPAGKTPPDTAS